MGVTKMGGEIDPEDIDVTVNPSKMGPAHEAAEGADSSGSVSLGSPKTWYKALLETEPHMDLDEVEPLWDPEAGGLSRIKRGLHKSGIPIQSAAWDFTLGTFEAVSGLFDEEKGTDGDDEIVGQP